MAKIRIRKNEVPHDIGNSRLKVMRDKLAFWMQYFGTGPKKEKVSRYKKV